MHKTGITGKPAPAKAAAAGTDEFARLQALLKKAGINASGLVRLLEVEGKPLFSLSADGVAAIKLWEKLRKLVETSGYWPVVLEHPDFSERADYSSSPQMRQRWARFLKKLTGRAGDPKLNVTQMLLQAASRFDSEAWLEKRSSGGATGEEDDEWAGISEAVGNKLHKAKPNTKFSGVFDVLTRKPKKGLTVALCPTREGWEVPAWMRMGGWNSCPYAHEQAAIFRRWKLKYDAELVLALRDVVEMRVGKPPKTHAAALELAREQYAFCDDIVNQGTMTLERLAGSLKGGTVWYFWWD